jgi:hypothetical protein
MEGTVHVFGMLVRATKGCLDFILCTITAIVLPAQTFTTLYNFCSQSGCPDGAYPDGTLVQVTDGNLYGTTYLGGRPKAPWVRSSKSPQAEP